MREVKELINKIELAIHKDLFSSKQEIKKIFDYKQKEREYYSKEIDISLNKLKNKILTLTLAKKSNTDEIKNINEASRVLEKVQEFLKVKSLSSLQKSRQLLLPLLNKQFPTNVKIKERKFVLPHLPVEVSSEIRANFYETEKCYNSSCFRSVLMLCAKILEIALHRKYFDLTSRDMLEKAPDLGLGNLVKRIKDQGFEFDPGLSNQISLINQLRIYSVHKKQQPFEPTKAQALATILYTLDTLKKLFKA